MSRVVIAKQPDLTFLNTSRKLGQVNDSPLPLILKEGGYFDWDANSYITELGGGSHSYNIKPKAQTIIKKAYSLNVFCSFIERENIKINEINDSTLYSFITELKNRDINDETILSHGKTALGYIIFLSKTHPNHFISTQSIDHDEKYKIHYEIKKFTRGNIEISYYHHASFSGLIHISSEPEFVRDHELMMWLDAIYSSKFHPKLNDFLITRWQALTTTLEITGSRISEVHQITRTMIKDAATSLLDSNKKIVIRNIPILKGKYKGKKRQIITTSEDLQIILLHINFIENTFPNTKHDALFVDALTGKPLSSSYLKNYTKKVINQSIYKDDLSHLTNHSFRHRFITLHVAKAIKKITASGGFKNSLDIAATACRKLTMHASNSSLSHYVHLASEYNEKCDSDKNNIESMTTQIRVRIKKMIATANLYHFDQISDSQALESILTTLEELKRL